MSDKTIRTAPRPGGAERMKRLLRLVASGRIDPTPLMTHRFDFSDIERTFRAMQTKADAIIKSLILVNLTDARGRSADWRPAKTSLLETRSDSYDAPVSRTEGLTEDERREAMRGVY